MAFAVASVASGLCQNLPHFVQPMFFPVGSFATKGKLYLDQMKKRRADANPMWQSTSEALQVPDKCIRFCHTDVLRTTLVALEKFSTGQKLAVELKTKIVDKEKVCITHIIITPRLRRFCSRLSG